MKGRRGNYVGAYAIDKLAYDAAQVHAADVVERVLQQAALPAPVKTARTRKKRLRRD